jgi:uncharacterized phage-associated protein
MASVFDAAQYLIDKIGIMTAIKLQKLVYYAQAWSLVWDEAPLFADKIEAWANGPVVYSLFERFRGLYHIYPHSKIGDSSNLADSQRETLDAIIRDYGPKDSHWLVELTHLEDPWRQARQRAGAMPGQKCREEITHADMAEYYSGLIN